MEYSECMNGNSGDLVGEKDEARGEQGCERLRGSSTITPVLDLKIT